MSNYKVLFVLRVLKNIISSFVDSFLVLYFLDVSDSNILPLGIYKLVAIIAIYTVEIQDLKLDLFIEDSPKTIPIYEKYVHVLCFDCRYNSNLKCENMTRVFSWYDIYVQINKRK